MTVPDRPAPDHPAPDHALTRLVAFDDAVVAIAATLLILPLVDLATGAGDLSVGALITENAYRLFAFVLSFTVIGRFWFVHFRMYTTVGSVSVPLVWANLLWLLSIVFLPFPTELVATAGAGDHAATMLYIGTMLVSTTANLLQRVIIVRSPRLQLPVTGSPPSTVGSLSNLVLMVAAFLIAGLIPAVGLWALLLLFLDGPVQAVMRRIRPG